jgi:hypothetical protein
VYDDRVLRVLREDHSHLGGAGKEEYTVSQEQCCFRLIKGTTTTTTTTTILLRSTEVALLRASRSDWKGLEKPGGPSNQHLTGRMQKKHTRV